MTMKGATANPANPLQSSEREQLPISERDRQEIEQLYEAVRSGKARLVSASGEAQLLPDSLHSFLVRLIKLLNDGKSVYIVQNQAKLTTVEAAAMLGVSRQFLINVLERGEIPYHLVGTHRRIYAHELLAYKARRDGHRRKILGELAQQEAAEGLYDRIPPVNED
jgi:excisionase family DNA binding protein